MTSRTGIMIAAAVMNLAAATSVQAQVAGEWKAEFGQWTNPQYPTATMKFVAAGSVTFQVSGDSVMALFTPHFEGSTTTVQADTLRGSLNAGKLSLKGSRVSKVRRVQMTADGEQHAAGEGETTRISMSFDLTLVGGELDGKMDVGAGEISHMVALVKLKRKD